MSRHRQPAPPPDGELDLGILAELLSETRPDGRIARVEAWRERLSAAFAANPARSARERRERGCIERAFELAEELVRALQAAARLPTPSATKPATDRAAARQQNRATAVESSNHENQIEDER